MTITEILEQAKVLSPQERKELAMMLIDMMDAPQGGHQPKTGADIVAMLEAVDGPIELADPWLVSCTVTANCGGNTACSIFPMIQSFTSMPMVGRGGGYSLGTGADFNQYSSFHMTRSLACRLPLFLSEWTQVVYHGNPLCTDTTSLALCDDDFGKHEAILLRFLREYGAVGEGSRPVAFRLITKEVQYEESAW